MALEARPAQAEARRSCSSTAGSASRWSSGQGGLQPTGPPRVAEALDEGDGFALFRGFKRLSLESAARVSLAGVATRARSRRQVRRMSSTIDRRRGRRPRCSKGSRRRSAGCRTGRPARPRGGRRRRRRDARRLRAGRARRSPCRSIEPDVTAPDLASGSSAYACPARYELVYRNGSFAHAVTDRHPPRPAGRRDRRVAVGGKAANATSGASRSGSTATPPMRTSPSLRAGPRSFLPTRPGLDRDASMQALLTAALATAPDSRNAGLVVETAQPKVTTADANAMGIVGVVGLYTTVYGGDPNRLHNVQLVSQLHRRPSHRAGQDVLVQRGHR